MDLNELYQEYIDAFLTEHNLHNVLSADSLGLYTRARKLHGRAVFPELLCTTAPKTKRSIKNLVDTWIDQNL